MDKCRICGEYKIEIFGSHRCGTSYQVVIIGNDDPPAKAFDWRMQLWCGRKFSEYGPDDAAQNAVADYQSRSAEYADNTTVGVLPWEQFSRWEDEHEDDDDALIDPALLTWYDVTLRIEPAYATHKLSRLSAGGGG